MTPPLKLNHKGFAKAGRDALCFDFGFDTMLARSLACRKAGGRCMVVQVQEQEQQRENACHTW